MQKLFDFNDSGNVFSLYSDPKLFHFLAEAGSADISITTPHLTDANAAQPSGDTGSVMTQTVAVETQAGTAPSPTGSGVSADSGVDPFLKSLTKDKEKNSDNNLMLQSLIKSEEKDVEKRKSILGELPKIDTSLFIDKEFHLKKQLSFVRVLFASIITVGFGLYLFFFTQLNVEGNFFSDQNVGTKVESTSGSLKSMMTDVNFNRYKTAKEYLDQFFYQSNEYLQKYDAWRAADDTKKGELAADLEKAKNDLIKPFEAARDILAKPNFILINPDLSLLPDTSGKDDATIAEELKKMVIQEFNDLLRASVADKKGTLLAEIKSAKNATDKELKKQELRDLTEINQLVGNDTLQQLIATDIKKMSQEQLRKHIIKISEKYNNRLAYIFQIKDKRIPWALLIKEIYDKTEASDDRFKTKLFKDIGGILYSGFDFDGSTGRLTISGSVKDFKGENFKILAILIDQLEGSRKFKDAEMRNFSKSFSEKDGFEGNFKIDLGIQRDDEIDERDKVIDLSSGDELFSANKKMQKVVEKIQASEKSSDTLSKK